MNIPIFLTLVRLISSFVLAPILVFVLPSASGFVQWVLAGVFVLIALTDAIDGYIARVMNQVSALGRELDHSADKVLIIGSLLALLAIGRAPFWLVFLLTMRELIVLGARLLAAEYAHVVHVSSVGRAKTWVQVMLVSVLIGPFWACFWCTSILGLAAVVLSWYSGLRYVCTVVNVLRKK